ncbi:MAG: hypothetical protein H6717_09425 [Polyangiaceae bacterium]|nr:hypothetical protein [Polyangiaceae bacterium]
MPRVLAHRWWIFLTLIGVLLLRGVAEGQPATTSTMAIGSKNFTENRLLAEMMAQLIEAHSDIRVERKVNLGAPPWCSPPSRTATSTPILSTPAPAGASI